MNTTELSYENYKKLLKSKNYELDDIIINNIKKLISYRNALSSKILSCENKECYENFMNEYRLIEIQIKQLLNLTL